MIRYLHLFYSLARNGNMWASLGLICLLSACGGSGGGGATLFSQAAAPGSSQSGAVGPSGSSTTSINLVVSPLNLDFGDVVTGSKALRIVQVSLPSDSNPTDITVTIKGVSFTSTAFQIVGSPFPMTISTTQAGAFAVEFTPLQVGSSSESFSFITGSWDSPTSVPLSGNGVTTSHSVALIWIQPTPVSGVTVTGYNIYRQDASFGCSGLRTNKALIGSVSGVSTTQYTDSKVVGGHTYCYVVTSVAGSVESWTDSNETKASIPSP